VSDCRSSLTLPPLSFTVLQTSVQI